MVFGPPVAGDLPDRVRAQIGWVQMAGILFFAVLYTISRKTFPEDAMLEPVPWALGVYFGFTVIRLSLAYAKRLPAWMIVISIVVGWSVWLRYRDGSSRELLTELLGEFLLPVLAVVFFVEGALVLILVFGGGEAMGLLAIPIIVIVLGMVLWRFRH